MLATCGLHKRDFYAASMVWQRCLQPACIRRPAARSPLPPAHRCRRWRLALACKRLAGLRGDWLQQVAVDRGTPFHLELNWGSIVARVANNSRLFGWDLWFAKWQREGITLGTQSLLRQCPLLESLRLTHPWVGEQLAEVSGETAAGRDSNPPHQPTSYPQPTASAHPTRQPYPL